MGTKENVARRIKIARAERGLDQKELAEMLTISQNLVSRYETGRVNLGVETLQRIADALQKPIAYFFEPVEEFRPRAAFERKADYDPKGKRRRDPAHEPARK